MEIFPFIQAFVTSFAYHYWNRNFRNDFANALTLRSRGWKTWVKLGGTCTYAILFSSRCSRYLSIACALKIEISDPRGALALHFKVRNDDIIKDDDMLRCSNGFLNVSRQIHLEMGFL